MGYFYTQRYFATRGVVFCSVRKEGFIPQGKHVPAQYLYATGLVWFSDAQVRELNDHHCSIRALL